MILYPDYELIESNYEKDSIIIELKTILRVLRNEKYYLLKILKNYIVTKENLPHKDKIILELLREFHKEIYFCINMSKIPEKPIFDFRGQNMFPLDENEESEEKRLKDLYFNKLIK